MKVTGKELVRLLKEVDDEINYNGTCESIDYFYHSWKSEILVKESYGGEDNICDYYSIEKFLEKFGDKELEIDDDSFTYTEEIIEKYKKYKERT